MNIQAILDRIPDSKRFLTGEEMDKSALALAKEFPEVCTAFIAGYSQENRPLYALKIGNGPKNAMILGCPHPNEPIGAMMLEAFTRILCEDEALRQELPFTFYVIKTWDADGLRRNEGWFNPPYTLYQYARNFYRPASTQQVEWTFPLDYKTLHFNAPLPETKAVMALIEQVKPDLLFSLHNSAFGGAFWYVNEKSDALIEALPAAAARQSIPLSLGEPEMPCCKTYAQAIFEFPGMPMMYDFYQETLKGQDPAQMLRGGSSSIDFANEDGRRCLGIVCEMPYFMNPDVMDLTKTDITRGEAMEGSAKIVEAGMEKIAPLIKALTPLLPEKDAYRMALEERLSQLPMMLASNRSFAQNDPSCKELATRAQRFDNLVALPFYYVAHTAGMIAKGAEGALKTAPAEDQAKLTAIVQQADALVRADCERITSQAVCQPIEIKRLVSVQMETALLALQSVQNG